MKIPPRGVRAFCSPECVSFAQPGRLRDNDKPLNQSIYVDAPVFSRLILMLMFSTRRNLFCFV